MQNSIRNLLCVAAIAWPLTAAIQQPVRTASGPVSGVPTADNAVIGFKGIPYAAPPVGDLRWCAQTAGSLDRGSPGPRIRQQLHSEHCRGT